MANRPIDDDFKNKSPEQILAEKIAKQLASKRITPEDMGTLKTLFEDRMDLLLALRNVMFGQANLSETEMVKEIFSIETNLNVLKKVLLPVLSPLDPIKQSIDLWQTIDVDSVSDERLPQIIAARGKLIEMLQQGLDSLDGGAPLVNLSVPDDVDLVWLKSRNSYISHVEGQLVFIITMALQHEDTPEELVTKLRKNSSK